MWYIEILYYLIWGNETMWDCETHREHNRKHNSFTGSYCLLSSCVQLWCQRTKLNCKWTLASIDDQWMMMMISQNVNKWDRFQWHFQKSIEIRLKFIQMFCKYIYRILNSTSKFVDNTEFEMTCCRIHFDGEKWDTIHVRRCHTSSLSHEFTC